MLRGSRAGTMEHAVDLGTFVGRFWYVFYLRHFFLSAFDVSV